MGTTPRSAEAPLSLRAANLARMMQLWADLLRVMQRTLSPIADLGIRLWLAQIFFVSGVLKVSNWTTRCCLPPTSTR